VLVCLCYLGCYSSLIHYLPSFFVVREFGLGRDYLHISLHDRLRKVSSLKLAVSRCLGIVSHALCFLLLLMPVIVIRLEFQ